MGRKRGYTILSGILFVLGFFFLDARQQGITGAFLGIPPVMGSVTGIFLWIIAGFLFMVGEGGLEKILKRERPKSIKEAIEANMIRWYIQQKELVPEDYRKHTRYVGRKIARTEFLDDVGKEAQYAPENKVEEIREFEEKVARKVRAYSYNPATPHKMVVYGMLHSAYGKEVGAYGHRLVRGIAVELQERGGKLYFHGYPVPEEEVLERSKKRRRLK